MGANMTYYVQDKRTKKILNLSGGWSESPRSYRVREFQTEGEALAAIPEGVPCWVFSLGRKSGEVGNG
jgi:hypothetical protein